MKPPRRQAAKPPAPQRRKPWWPWALAALIVVFVIYGPALEGPFVFDDSYLPFTQPGVSESLRVWTSGVRPLLMASYWVNFRLSGAETLSYHIVNVLLHVANAGLVFLVLRKLSGAAAVSGLCAALFLLHPAQAESVAYVAGRSETLSALCFFGALCVFLYRRREAVTWGVAAAVLLLFLGALASKEHTLTLPALLLLTDYYFNPGFSLAGIRRNWRLYAPIAAGAAAGLAFVWNLVLAGGGAGFALKEFTWYQYFFTQWRAVFTYLRVFLLPARLAVDYDYPISRTPLEHGAILGLLGLLALTGAAWVFRRRYPLASYGWMTYLILLAPTSSIVPIADPVADRRLYLPMLGLLLIAAEFLRRVESRRVAWAAAALLLATGIAAHLRAQAWESEMAFWQDAVQKAPRKARPRFHLAYAYFASGECAAAVQHYEATARLQAPGYDLLVDWALAYDCLNQSGPALEKLRAAAQIESRAHVWSLMGMVHAKQSRWGEALEALAAAEKLDPAYAMTYAYRGGVMAAQGNRPAALENYRRALALEPSNPMARQGLASLGAR